MNRRPVAATWYQRALDGTYIKTTVDKFDHVIDCIHYLTAEDLPQGVAERCNAVASSATQNYVVVRA